MNVHIFVHVCIGSHSTVCPLGGVRANVCQRLDPFAKLNVLLCFLQSNQQPKKLKVYPAQVDDDGNIAVKFFTANA